ncbi:ABC transporter permease [Propionicicella superfundia]|uniref:ABC transporter permease n=1 Tax=Propionicicella superfundia TaxID=348582 RepID=UPI000420D262|nr:ABC transporter permease [Propionicicella superfundia]
MSLRRLLNWFVMSLLLFFVLSALLFVLVSLTPGDAARTIVGPNASVEQYEQVRRELGLDLPVWQQYGNWLMGLLRGDLGDSIVSGAPVGQVLADRLEPTLSLILCTFVCASVLGIALGVIGASRPGIVGKAADALSVVGSAVPNFWIGLVLATIFAVHLRWLPTSGYAPIVDGVGPWLARMVLPVATLTIGSTALLAKQTRDAVAEQLAQPYIVLLRAHGVSEHRILWRHALRGAAVPIVTILGMKMVGLTTGTVLVESVFVIPGFAGYAVDATLLHDIPVVQAITLIFSIVIIVTNLIVELLYARLNVKEIS